MSEKYFEIKVEEMKNLADRLKELAAEYKDNFRQFLKIIDVKLRAAIDENFLTEGKSLGQKWAEWSEKYKKWRIKHYGGGQILTREGNLRESFVSEIEDNSLTIGTAKEYAAIHNFGHKKKKMPQREYFVFTDKTIEEVLEDLNDYARELSKKTLKA